MNLILTLLLGLCYAAVFWVLAVMRPRLALLLIFASAPFQNDVSGGGPIKFSPAEINILLSLPVVLIKSRRILFGSTLAPALAYLAICAASVSVQWRLSAPASLMQIGLYTVVSVTVFASLARDEQDYLLAFKGAIAVAVVFAATVLISRSAYIFGLHKNGVGGSLAVAFVITLELWLSSPDRKKRRLYMFACSLIAFGCFMTLSRGAWLAAVTGALVILALRRKFQLILRSVLVLVPIIALGWLLLPKESRDYATGFSASEHYNIKLRYESIDYAWSTFVSNPVLGAGVGLRKEYDATNVALLTLAETGALGLIAFFFLHVAVIVMVWKALRRALPQSLSSSILAIALALTLGKFMHGLVDHYWSRGSLTMVWASVGMAARVAYDQKLLRRRLARARASGAPQEMPLVPTADGGVLAN